MKRLLLAAAFLLMPSLAMAQGLAVSVPNAGTTGTVLNSLAKLTGAPSTAVKTATTDTAGAEGVVVSGAGTSGNALILKSGQATCNFDGATTAGDAAIISASVAGDCSDAGAACPAAGQQMVGRVLSTNGASGAYAMNVGNAARGNSVACGGTGATTGAGASVNLSHSYIVCVPTLTTLTGTTAETVIADCAIPGNLLGTNNMLRLYFLASIPGNTNSKSFNIRYAATSGTGGTACGSAVSTSSASNINLQLTGNLYETGATNSQLCTDATANPLSAGIVGIMAVDTTATSHIVVTGTLAVGTDTITPLMFKVELLPAGGN